MLVSGMKNGQLLLRTREREESNGKKRRGRAVHTSFRQKKKQNTLPTLTICQNQTRQGISGGKTRPFAAGRWRVNGNLSDSDRGEKRNARSDCSRLFFPRESVSPRVTRSDPAIAHLTPHNIFLLIPSFYNAEKRELSDALDPALGLFPLKI